MSISIRFEVEVNHRKTYARGMNARALRSAIWSFDYGTKRSQTYQVLLVLKPVVFTRGALCLNLIEDYQGTSQIPLAKLQIGFINYSCCTRRIRTRHELHTLFPAYAQVECLARIAVFSQCRITDGGRQILTF